MRLITHLLTLTLILIHSSLTASPIFVVPLTGIMPAVQVAQGNNLRPPGALAKPPEIGSRAALAASAAPLSQPPAIGSRVAPAALSQPPGVIQLAAVPFSRPATMARPAAGVGEWIWPIEGTVVRPYAPGDKPWLPGHRGVDLAGEEAQPVRAAGDGIVHFAGWVVSRPVVSILHRNGLLTTYEPVNPLVHTGDVVAEGDVIGLLATGHPGCASPCLHWGLRQGENYLDPLLLLGFGRVRLLPPEPA